MNAKLLPATLVGLATLALVPSIASARAAETTVVYADGSSQTTRAPDRKTHTTGLMIRYTVGGSYARTGQSFDTIGKPKYHVHGVALDMSLAAGFAFSEKFSMHGTALFWRAFNPKAKGDFAGLSPELSSKDTQLLNFGLGGGFTFWTANNMYFSLSVVASMLRAEVKDYTSDTKWGVGGEVLFGKEWWIGGNLGIGFAAATNIHYIPDKRATANGLVGFSVGPRLTLTFN